MMVKKSGDLGSLTTGVGNSLKHDENVIFLSHGAFIRWGFCPPGILSVEAFIRWGFYPLGLLSVGLFSAGLLSVGLLSAGLLSYTHMYLLIS